MLAAVGSWPASHACTSRLLCLLLAATARGTSTHSKDLQRCLTEGLRGTLPSCRLVTFVYLLGDTVWNVSTILQVHPPGSGFF